MAVQGFSNENDLCAADSNPDKVEQGVYFEGSVRAGMEIFTDAAKTTKKSSGYYLLKSGNRNYKIFITATGTVNLIGECTDISPTAEVLFAMPPLASGNGWMNASGVINPDIKLVVNEVSGRLKLTDEKWSTWNPQGAGESKVFFLSNRNKLDYGRNVTPDFDVEDMRGFSFSPRKAVVSDANDTFITDTQEQYIHIPATSGQNRRKWTEGDVTYAFMPPQYIFSGDSNVMQFDLLFPDFEIPAGNVCVLQPYPTRDNVNQNLLRKGCTYVKGTNVLSKKAAFVGDDFLIALGCPKPYTGDETAFNAWVPNTSGPSILNSFISLVFNQYKDYGYVFMNWEYVNTRWNVDRWKIDQCIEYWQTNNASGQILGWIQKAFGLGKDRLHSNQNPAALLRDWKFSGSMNDYLALPDLQVNGSYPSTAVHWDMLMVGEYQTTFYDTMYLHHIIIEGHVNKKFFPTKKIISTLWYDYEPLEGHPASRQHFNQAPNGTVRYEWCKAQTAPDVCQSYAVVSHFILDGGDVWDEYGNGFTENQQYWGLGGITVDALGSFDLNNNPLPNNWEPGTGAHYPVQTMKNMDWYMAGVWAVAQLKDILDSGNPIVYAEHSADNGVTWATGDNTLPCVTVFGSGIIAAYVMGTTGTQAALLVCNPFGAANTQATIKVRIGSKTVDIKTFGKYASAVRVINI